MISVPGGEFFCFAYLHDIGVIVYALADDVAGLLLSSVGLCIRDLQKTLVRVQ